MGSVRLSEADRRKWVLAAYDCALSDEAWPGFLSLLASGVGAVGASHSKRVGRQARIACSSLPLAATSAYDRYWATQDPCIEPVDRMAPGFVTSTRTAVPKVERTAFFNDYAKAAGRTDWLILNTFKAPGRRSQILIAREAGDTVFDEADIEAVRFVSPHLLQAAAIAMARRALEDRIGALESGLEAVAEPLFLIDAGRKIRHANQAALAVLADGGLLRSSSGILTSPDVASFRRLEAAVAAVDQETRTFGCALRHLRIDGAGKQLVLIIQGRMSPGADLPAISVRVLDPSRAAAPSPQSLTEAFGLTRAEAEVLVSACAGATAEEIADLRGVKVSTVRWQIRCALERMDAGSLRRAAGLISRLSPLSSEGAPLAGGA